MTALDSRPVAPSAVQTDRSPAPPRPVAVARWWDRWWLPALVVPLMLASDWKLRRRGATSALSGQADLQVMAELAVYGLVAVYLVLRHGRAPRLRRTTPLLFTMWFFGTTLAFSALYAVYPPIAIARGIQVVIVCALAQTVTRHCRVDHLHRFAHAYLGLVAFAVLLGFVAPLPISGKVAGRFHWLYVHPVPGGIYLMIGVVLAAAYLRNAALRDVLALWPRWVYGALLGWIGIGLVLTKTRGSIAGGVVGVLLVLVLQTRAKTKIDVAGLLVLLGATLVVFAGAAILSYLERGQNIQKLSTLNERTNLWSLAWRKFLDRPILGYGLGSSRGIFLKEIGLGGGHNAFVNAMVDTGMVGLSAFTAMIVIVVAVLVRFGRETPGRRDALILLPLVAALLTNSMTAEFIAVPTNNANIWLLLIVAWTALLQRAGRSWASAT